MKLTKYDRLPPSTCTERPSLRSPSSPVQPFLLHSAVATACYNAGGCQQCETETSMYDARQSFCGSNDWKGSTSVGWGWGRVTLDGSFATSQQCFDGFNSIIQTCYGKKDGGIYTYEYNGHNARLDVNFCNCE